MSVHLMSTASCLAERASLSLSQGAVAGVTPTGGGYTRHAIDDAKACLRSPGMVRRWAGGLRHLRPVERRQ